MKYVLLIILYSFSLLGVENPRFTCVIISGEKKDWNKTFSITRRPIMDTENQTISGHNCVKVDGWSELDRYSESLPKNSQILIHQGTHESKGGVAHCNNGDDDSSKILDSLNTL